MSTALPTAAKVDRGVISQSASLTFQATFAMLLGALIVGIAGFSQSDVIHNAAHDTRHANGFPCH
jgi:cobalt transporter subunit CbtB